MDTLYGNRNITIPDLQTENVSRVRQCPNSESFVNDEILENAEIVPPHEVEAFDDNTKGLDCRPRLKDGEVSFLLDSGSMCGVWPTATTDVVDRSIHLKSVDGSPFDCYGMKEIEVKIGRKTYHYQVVKAKVKAPIIGWDFFHRYKLDLVWGEFGDIFLRDKRANIQKRLEHVQLPHG